MSQAGTIQTFGQGRPLWFSWLGVLVLFVVCFGMFWLTLAIFDLGSTATREVSRVTNDGAFGFSAAEWTKSFRLSLNRSLLLTATCPAACVLGLMLRRVWKRWSRAEAPDMD